MAGSKEAALLQSLGPTALYAIVLIQFETLVIFVIFKQKFTLLLMREA